MQRDSTNAPTDGDYQISVEMTHSGFLGALVLEVALDIKVPVEVDEVVAERTAEYDAAEGYFGAGHTVTVAANYGLVNYQYDETKMTISADESADGDATVVMEIIEGNAVPANGELVLELTADIVCTDGRDCAETPLVVAATFNAIAHPLQPDATWTFGEDADLNFALPPPPYSLPSSERSFAIESLEGVTNLADLENNGILQFPDDTAPNLTYRPDTDLRLAAGTYTLIASMEHPDLLGVLLLEVDIVVEPADLGADYQVDGLNPADKILVVAGFADTAYSVTTVADAVLNLPDPTPSGVALNLVNSGTKVDVRLDPALTDDEVAAAIALTVVRQDSGADDPNYNPLPQVLNATISALAEPPVAQVEAGIADTGAVFTVGADYQNGVYDGAAFSEVGETPDLNVSAGGEITIPAALAAGAYGITVAAANIPNVRGEEQITVSLTALAPIPLNDAVAEADRNATLDAAAGYFGFGHEIRIETDYALTGETFHPAALGYDDALEIISILESNPVPQTGELVLAVTAVASFTGTGRFLAETPLTVTATFRSVSDPGQAAEEAVYSENFSVSLALPAGYENDSEVSLEIIEVSGDDGVALPDLSAFSLDGPTLEYDASAIAAIDAGGYEVQIDMTRPTGLLGTVALNLQVNVAPAPLAEGDYDLADGAAARAPEVITVAADAGSGSGVNLTVAIHQVSLLEAATEAVLRLPDPIPAGFEISLAGDDRAAEFYLASQLQPEAERNETALLTIFRHANYQTPEQAVALRVSALAATVAEVRADVSAGSPYNESSVYDFGVGVFAGATFEAATGSDTNFEISSAGVVAVSSPIVAAQTYEVAALATNSSQFRGRALVRLRVILSEAGQVQDTDSIPAGERTVARLVAASYEGSVAFFAAATDDVGLQTPATAPSGFNFGPGGEGATFTAPAGFTVFLDSPGLGEGESAGAAFTVTASQASREPTDVPLEVTVDVVAAPDQAVLNATGGQAFPPHPLAYPANLRFAEADAVVVDGVLNAGTDEAGDAVQFEIDGTGNLIANAANLPRLRKLCRHRRRHLCRTTACWEPCGCR